MSEFQDTQIPPVGIVLLKDKQIPVCELPEPFADHYCVTRGIVDVNAFKAKLNSLSADAWEDENQEGNVRLTRPAHDAWGIKKIVFNFCDDFLMKVLDLPFSRLAEWRDLLLPIYNAIGVDESKIVRSLLASMPPGVTIPVHHDTGYWVKHCHRIHVAIDTGPEVDFFVGPTNDQMRKYLFDEGRIVELNNQAKHAVNNNMKKHRVHLIFDYVDDHPITRHSLMPGEIVYQTRRSIDLARGVDKASYEVRPPGFVIIGAQKSGTTSVYEFICQHPLVLKGMRRETHYFDWRYNHSLGSDLEAHFNYYMKFYQYDVLKKHKSLITGESTPSYLLHSDIVIPRMKALCPWTKVIIILRNPVDRAYSQYQMCIDPVGTKEQLAVRGESSFRNLTFEDAIDAEIKELQEAGITPDSPFELFQSKILSKCPMTHGGHSLVARGLYVLQVAQWQANWPTSQLKILSINDIKGEKYKVQQCLDDVFSFIGIPPIDVTDLSAKNTRSYNQPISVEARTKLERFYAPFNVALYEILGYEISQW